MNTGRERPKHSDAASGRASSAAGVASSGPAYINPEVYGSTVFDFDARRFAGNDTAGYSIGFRESQRDSIIQPRVAPAPPGLPWVTANPLPLLFFLPSGRGGRAPGRKKKQNKLFYVHPGWLVPRDPGLDDGTSSRFTNDPSSATWHSGRVNCNPWRHAGAVALSLLHVSASNTKSILW
jgi:hypothetical protein